jgi:hypothetical protein
MLHTTVMRVHAPTFFSSVLKIFAFI